MSEHNPPHDEHDRNPENVPLLQGRISSEEQARIDEQKSNDAKYKSEEAFKNRQITATEAANKLSSRSIAISVISGIIALFACGGTLYQGHVSRASLAITKEMLEEMKSDSQASSAQFRAQLAHYDAGLGVTQVIAGEATTQAFQTTNLANDTHDLAIQAKNQSDATKAIAIGTKSTAASNQQLLRAQMDKDKASVSIQNPRIIFDRDRIPLVQVDLVNNGNTSAENVRYTTKPLNSTGSNSLDNRETTALKLKEMGDFSKSKDWKETQDISARGSVPIDFATRKAENSSAADVALVIKGRVEYDTTFGKRWKNFCLLVVSLNMDRHWDYNARFCIVGQDGDRAEPREP